LRKYFEKLSERNALKKKLLSTTYLKKEEYLFF